MKLISILLLSGIILVSCQRELQTSEQFVNQFMTYLKEDNNSQLYSECYISSKSEIKKLLQEVSRSKSIDNKQVNKMYKASKEEKNNLSQKTRVLINANSSIRIDSIINSPQKIKGFGGDFEPTKGTRLNNINAYLNIDDINYKILFQCVDLNSGKWKILNHPEVTKIK